MKIKSVFGVSIIPLLLITGCTTAAPPLKSESSQADTEQISSAGPVSIQPAPDASVKFALDQEGGYFTIKKEEVISMLSEIEPDFMKNAKVKEDESGMSWTSKWEDGSYITLMISWNSEGFVYTFAFMGKDMKFPEGNTVVDQYTRLLDGIVKRCTTIQSPGQALSKAVDQGAVTVDGTYIGYYILPSRDGSSYSFISNLNPEKIQPKKKQE